jgi:hypothetical protein
LPVQPPLTGLQRGEFAEHPVLEEGAELEQPDLFGRPDIGDERRVEDLTPCRGGESGRHPHPPPDHDHPRDQGGDGGRRHQARHGRAQQGQTDQQTDQRDHIACGVEQAGGHRRQGAAGRLRRHAQPVEEDRVLEA